MGYVSFREGKWLITMVSWSPSKWPKFMAEFNWGVSRITTYDTPGSQAPPSSGITSGVFPGWSINPQHVKKPFGSDLLRKEKYGKMLIAPHEKNAHHLVSTAPKNLEFTNPNLGIMIHPTMD